MHRAFLCVYSSGESCIHKFLLKENMLVWSMKKNAFIFLFILE